MRRLSMPKILIKEIDKTKPGAPDSYSNFAVLIAGFAGTPKAAPEDRLQADTNGIYEFSSPQDFENTIGLVGPKSVKTVEAAPGSGGGSYEITTCHYGNQMAYELLNLGYPIIYAPITDISALTDLDFWAIFKDKSSYDFRFIVHGLLESASSPSAQYDQDTIRIEHVKEAIEQLKQIAKNNNISWDIMLDPELNDGVPEHEGINNAYEKLANSVDPVYFGLYDYTAVDGEATYDTYLKAVRGTARELELLENRLTPIDECLVTAATIAKANACIANLARYNSADADNPSVIPGRGDCIALIELDEKAYLTDTSNKIRPESLIMDAIDTNTGIDADNGKYCALTVPSVYYKMAINKEFNNNVKFPGSFHYLACFKNSLNMGFAEWYAAAGYTRGVSSYVIDTTSVKLGEIAINALEPRNYIDDPQIKHPKFACNVIAHFRGSYYLWGNRTAHPIGRKGSLENGDLTASSFLNIRNLCTTIKKQLYVSCRSFTFDPNSDTLWVNFVNSIKPTLEAMKADQGIKDYRILKQQTDKKATLKAKIRIIPIEAVEDFDLEISLEDSFGETTATVAE